MLKTYHIDLNAPEGERWSEVIAYEAKTARRLLHAFEEGTSAPGWLLGPAMRAIYKMVGGLYRGEIGSWADGLEMSPGLLVAAQCSYELSMVGGYTGEVFGCTSAVVDHPKFGPTLIRYLDWDLPALSRATRVFVFHDGEHEFHTVGVPGFVGALSGYVPGAYAVAINQAPCSQGPGLSMGATTLLRETLAECRTYAAAVRKLSRTALSAPCFFIVCGTRRGEACVIERRKYEYDHRRMKKGAPLIQTNHHLLWSEHNLMEQEEMDDSDERLEQTTRALERPSKTLEGLVDQIAQFPTYSSLTVQRMAFSPRARQMFAVAG